MAKFFRRIFDIIKKWFSHDVPNEDTNVGEEVIETPVEDIEIEEPQEEDDDTVAATPTDTNILDDEKEPFIKILVDNGHGYDTPGKKSPYSCYKVLPELPFEEWKWAREISHALVKELTELGYDADLLVPEENDVPLKERVRRVNEVCNKLGKNNVILISIHANAAGNGKEWLKARGWSAFTTKGATKSDELASHLYTAALRTFNGKKIRTDYSDGDPDWEENFYIIKNTYCPAVLTENFFYDNIDDVTYILSDKGKEDILKVHVRGITSYLDDLKK